MLANNKSLALLASALTLLGGLSWLAQPAAQAQQPDTLKQLQTSDEMVKSGAELFKANGCNGCHGDLGKGDGLAAAALNPKPRNFHAKDGWKNGQSFAGMYKTLEEGVPGSAMNSFSHLPAKDRVALINYVRSLEPSNFPPVTAQDVETLQKSYNLSEALTKGANKVIPVDLAVEKLIAEAAPQQAQIKGAVDKLMAASGSDAQLIKASISNPERAFSMLVNAGGSWKGSLQDFSRMVELNTDVNGFRAGTASYGNGQWQALQNALKKFI